MHVRIAECTYVCTVRIAECTVSSEFFSPAAIYWKKKVPGSNKLASPWKSPHRSATPPSWHSTFYHKKIYRWARVQVFSHYRSLQQRPAPSVSISPCALTARTKRPEWFWCRTISLSLSVIVNLTRQLSVRGHGDGPQQFLVLLPN